MWIISGSKAGGVTIARKRYPSDLTDEEWEAIKKYLPKPSTSRGRKPRDRREIINAIFYMIRTGCQRPALPHDFPNWKRVSTVFWRWRKAGVWQQIHDKVREVVRQSAGKEKSPSAGIIDSQSVKTTAVGGEGRGCEAAEKVSGRKGHAVVDTLGLILAVVVHAACVQEQHGARMVLGKTQGRFERMKMIFADPA